MCGRATIIDPGGIERIAIEFSRRFLPTDWTRPRYNIRPTDPIPVLREVQGDRELTMLRWWLIPRGVTEPGKLPTFNARAETLAVKPSFRSSFKDRRCLVVVDGFYEWPKKPSSDKRPRLICLADRRPMTLAGLWDRWRDPKTGVRVESCTIVTTDANALLKAVPHDRMPVILEGNAREQWLDVGATDRTALQELLVPREADSMESVIVSSEFVNYGVDDARCVEPWRDDSLFGDMHS